MFLILLLSVISLVVQNIKDKSNIIINDEKLENKEGKIAVYIAGEVKNPGVYYIDEDSRLTDLIEMCGGFTKEADISDLNLAEKLSDSDKIDVPKIDKEEYVSESETSDNGTAKSGLIDINRATKDELKTLSGIGDTLADNIIKYRQENTFECIEDIMNVNGIGESKFESIKEYICVN